MGCIMCFMLKLLLGFASCLAYTYAFEKPGSCPKPMGFGTCVELCSGDDSCPGFQKCCSNGCGHVCMNPVPVVKPGFCPAPGIGICVELCGGDQTCPGDQKCCSNGCGHACMDPVYEKPGECPKNLTSDECIRGCPSDSSCPGDLKCCQQCCPQSCGGVCVKPVICEDDPNYKKTFKYKGKKCKKCTCADIAERSKKMRRKFCKNKKRNRKCCATCSQL